MKQLLIITFVITGLISCHQSSKNNTTGIYGRWNTSFKNGDTVLAVFRTDGTHDYFINGKLFSNGNFTFENGQLSESDPICNGSYYATYKVIFPSPNEMQFAIVQDTCTPRAHDLDGIKMKRAE